MSERSDDGRGTGRPGRGPARSGAGRRGAPGGGSRGGRGGSGRARAGATGEAATQRRRPSGPTSDAGREADAALPDDVSGTELDNALRAELGGLMKDNASVVARHLVMVGRLLDEDPEQAYAHAMAARRRAGRVGSVREVAGVAAYRTGRFDEALAELRAARRITGSPGVLPLMADSERGLGRPERALALASSEEAGTLDRAGRIEMRIVEAGARRDLGQPGAAVLALALPELRARGQHPWLARLRYAYADALEADGRPEEARTWFGLALEADAVGETDADERLAALDGVVFVSGDPDDEDDSDDRPDEAPEV